MGLNIIISPGGGGSGASDWSELTGKPAMETTVGDPGSDANLVTEQAVRESLNKNKVQGFSFVIENPETREYIITDKWPIDVPCEVTLLTHRAEDTDPDTTVTANWKINSTSLTGASAVPVTLTESDVIPSAANVLAQGDQFSITLSSLVGTGELRFTVRYERAN